MLRTNSLGRKEIEINVSQNVFLEIKTKKVQVENGLGIFSGSQNTYVQLKRSTQSFKTNMTIYVIMELISNCVETSSKLHIFHNCWIASLWRAYIVTIQMIKASVNENEPASTTKYGKTMPCFSFNSKCNFIQYNEENMWQKRNFKKNQSMMISWDKWKGGEKEGMRSLLSLS